jgi:outer membrane autotransporter protein
MLGSGNTHQLAGYVAYQQPLFHVGVAGLWGTSDMQSERRIAFGDVDRHTRAEFGGGESGASIEAGLHLGDPGVLLVEPTAGFQFARLDQDGFRELGAGALDLEVAPATVDALVSRLDVGLSRMLPLRNEFGIQPELRLGWSHDSGDRGRHVDARFSGALGGDGRFRVAGAERNRDAFHLEAGYVMRVSDVPLLSLRYALRLSEDESRHDLTAALLLHW